MALSANANIKRMVTPAILTKKLVDGALHVYRMALLNYEAANIGYAKLGSDTLSEEFCGIALEEVDVSAAQNTADGTYTCKVYPRGNGDLFLLPVRSNITIANEGDPVYVDGDDYVDIASGIVNTTNGFVGIIREFVSTNSAYVQMTQHPIL